MLDVTCDGGDPTAVWDFDGNLPGGLTLGQVAGLKVNGASPTFIDLVSGSLVILDYAAIVAVGQPFTCAATATFAAGSGVVTA